MEAPMMTYRWWTWSGRRTRPPPRPTSRLCPRRLRGLHPNPPQGHPGCMVLQIHHTSSTINNKPSFPGRDKQETEVRCQCFLCCWFYVVPLYHRSEDPLSRCDSCDFCSVTTAESSDDEPLINLLKKPLKDATNTILNQGARKEKRGQTLSNNNQGPSGKTTVTKKMKRQRAYNNGNRATRSEGNSGHAALCGLVNFSWLTIEFNRCFTSPVKQRPRGHNWHVTVKECGSL